MTDLLRPPGFGKPPDRDRTEAPPEEAPRDQDARLRKAMVAVVIGAAIAVFVTVLSLHPYELGGDPFSTISSILTVVGIVVAVTVLAPRARRGAPDRKALVRGSLLIIAAALVLAAAGFLLYSFLP
jgi:hypothetical protein